MFTGWRRWFPFVSEPISKVTPLDGIRHLSYSHFEGDECGAMNEFLAAAPLAVPFASQIGALTSLHDYADRPPRGLADGDEFLIGRKTLQWIYTPHVPHGWDCGLLFDQTTRTLLCGDLFTQPGADTPPVTETLEYYAHGTNTTAILGRLAGLEPATLACQHGSAYRGDGGALLRELSGILAQEQPSAMTASVRG